MIVPLLQCQAADSRRLAFSTLAYGQEISGLQPGQPLAVFGLTMAMESVLARGTFGGFRRVFGVKTGSMDIDLGLQFHAAQPLRDLPARTVAGDHGFLDINRSSRLDASRSRG